MPQYFGFEYTSVIFIEDRKLKIKDEWNCIFNNAINIVIAYRILMPCNAFAYEANFGCVFANNITTLMNTLNYFNFLLAVYQKLCFQLLPHQNEEARLPCKYLQHKPLCKLYKILHMLCQLLKARLLHPQNGHKANRKNVISFLIFNSSVKHKITPLFNCAC